MVLSPMNIEITGIFCTNLSLKNTSNWASINGVKVSKLFSFNVWGKMVSKGKSCSILTNELCGGRQLLLLSVLG